MKDTNWEETQEYRDWMNSNDIYQCKHCGEVIWVNDTGQIATTDVCPNNKGSDHYWEIIASGEANNSLRIWEKYHPPGE